MSDERRHIVDDLLVDQTEILRKAVSLAKGILGLNEKTGEPVILTSESKLANKGRIYLKILGEYFTSFRDQTRSASVKTADIARSVGLNEHTTRAHLSQLKEKGVIASESPGTFRIVEAKIEDVLMAIRDGRNIA